MVLSRRNGKRSIVGNLYACAECGLKCQGAIETHEVFHGFNRRKSLQDGMVIGLCTYHHQRWHGGDDPEDAMMRWKWKKVAQLRWEKEYGTREQFMRRYGRSYIDAD